VQPGDLSATTGAGCRPGRESLVANALGLHGIGLLLGSPQTEFKQSGEGARFIKVPMG
jgi:hypothetical protein